MQPLWKGTVIPNGIEHGCSKQWLPAPSFPSKASCNGFIYPARRDSQMQVWTMCLQTQYPEYNRILGVGVFYLVSYLKKKFQICKFAVNTHRTSCYSSGKHSGTKKLLWELEGPPVSTFAWKYFLPYKVSTLLMPLTKERHQDVVPSMVASCASCFSMVFGVSINYMWNRGLSHSYNKLQKKHLEVLLVIYSRDLGIHWFLEKET